MSPGFIYLARPTKTAMLRTLELPVNPTLSPPGGLFFPSTFEGGGGCLFNLAKRIIGSKNTAVRDRVDLRVVQVTVNSI